METVLHEASSNGVRNSHVEYHKTSNEVKVEVNGNSVAKNCDANFTRLPTRTPIDISFEDIIYNAPLGFRKGYKQIIHSISGRFPPGQLIAIMGPSGAGKSTLLDILSGYRKTDIDGTVYINGEKRDLRSFRKMSCYITQDDRLQTLLTVKENMMIAADLKLHSDVTLREKMKIIHEILVILRLIKAKHTITGQLSGGQKKRLSIALELINNPLVMFLDEPTTGLDSSSCNQCINLLQVLARQGRTIVCTIHQPSASMFQLFDQVYALSSGKCIYQGSPSNMVKFFSNLGAPCPLYHNPADYLIEIACEEYGRDILDKMIEIMDNGASLDYFHNREKLPCVDELRERAELEYQEDDEEGLETTTQWNQLKVLMRRGFMKLRRDQTLTYMRIGVNISVGLLLGTIYWQSGQNASRTIDNYNLLFTVLMQHLGAPMMLTILTFPYEMNILMKEHFNRWYSLKMYYLSVNIVEIPLSIICVIVFMTLVFFMTGQPFEWERFGMFITIGILLEFVSQSLGLMIGAVFDVLNGCFIGPVLLVPIMMFAGFGVRINDLPPWLYWGSYVSFLRYGLEGAVAAIYGLKREKLICPEEAEYCMHAVPSRFLQEIGIADDMFWVDVAALAVFLCSFKIMAYCLLRLKMVMIR